MAQEDHVAKKAKKIENVLVTGSEGFLGKRLCDALKTKGYKVHGFDLPLGHDILNQEQISNCVKDSKSDVVIHLAAVADLNISAKDPEKNWKINVEGTEKVLKACTDNGARMLFASTCCCYGNNNCHPSDESSPIAPTEVYAKSKAEAEHFVRDAGAPHTSMRLATFYGPGMRAALAPQVFLDKIVAGEKINIHGTGKQTRTYTYVDDIVSGIICIMENTEKTPPLVNVTTDKSYSVLELAELAMKAAGKTVELHFGEDRPGQIHKEYLSCDLLRSLGWEPKVDLPEGLVLSYKSMMAGKKADDEEKKA